MEEFDRLVQLLETLRGEKGCPWDKRQTVQSFKTFLLEEVYELIHAIETGDNDMLREEMGDLLFHILFISQICREHGLFDIRDVLNRVYDKMYHRHPHVFAPDSSDLPIEQRWEELKKSEKEGYSPLENIPRIIPALLRAYIVSKRASRAGFDWEKLDDVYEKMSEEIGELKAAEKAGNREAIREEIGDLLFTVANISRFHGVDPEDALRLATDKFLRRFAYIEKNTDLSNASLTTMDRLWNEKKGMERKG
jgi:tetrapyrrole methylase family protein / MazG family protein